MKTYLKILILVFVIASISIFSVEAKQQASCGAIYNQFEHPNEPANCYGTIVTNDAWLSFNSNDSEWYYLLRYGDRVIVKYQENGYYCVVWYFDGSRDPLAGWIKIDKILLDRDVKY